MISRKIITKTALDVGFDLVGVVRAEHLTKEHNYFNEWLLEGNASTLDYLKRNVEKRFDASLLVEGARSVVICAISYLSPYSRGYNEGAKTKIASYALARDYHVTIKELLSKLAEQLKTYSPQARYRAYTDSAPLAEKSYAVRAGLGWIGRNSLLVTLTTARCFTLASWSSTRRWITTICPWRRRDVASVDVALRHVPTTPYSTTEQ